MTNRLAPYKDPSILHNIQAWWQSVALTPQDKRTFGDLFSSYTRQQLDDYDLQSILTTQQFAKCLTQAHIIHLGAGSWALAPDYTPTSFALTRAAPLDDQPALKEPAYVEE